MSEYPTHNCKRNHVGTSASMETSLAVRMQAELAGKGARLSLVVGDCDTHVDAHLNSCPDKDLRDVKKCLDLNHMVKNIKKTLFSLKDKYYKSNTVVLTPIIIGHLCATFTRVVYRHRIDPRNSVLPLEAVDLFDKLDSNAKSLHESGMLDEDTEFNATSADTVDKVIMQHLSHDQLTGEEFGPDFAPFNFDSGPPIDEGDSCILEKLSRSYLLISDVDDKPITPRDLLDDFEDTFSVDVEDCRSLKSSSMYPEIIVPSNAADSAEQAVLQLLEKGHRLFSVFITL